MAEAHSQRAHARLAPSAAHRWLNCPGSIAASDGIEQKTSRFADEGTAAHTLAEHCFRCRLDADHYLGWLVDVSNGQLMTGAAADAMPGEDLRTFEVTEEMAEAVQVFLDTIRPLCDGAEYASETRLDLSHIDGMDSGTADFSAYDPVACRLTVVDLKYGKGVAVDPCEPDGKPNPQLATYASGVMRRYIRRGLRVVELIVVQPRAAGEPVKSALFSPLDLMEFEEDLREGATRTRDPNAPRVAGEWCKFCPAAPTCPENRAAATALAEDVFGEIVAPDSLPAEKLASVLRKAFMLKNWLRAVEEYAHDEAMAGRVPPGFKLVDKRAVRKWDGDEGAILNDLFYAGIDIGELMTKPELKSPAQVEALMPGKNKKERAAALAPFVKQVSSGTNLVPIEDPRAPARPALEDVFE